MERYEEIWRKQRREKIYDAICWIVLVPVMLFALVWWILTRLFPDLVQLVSFFYSFPVPIVDSCAGRDCLNRWIYLFV